eukprot:Skav204587  [mRNA]  locus=scaffold672:66042:66353:- [translate_table: standard]
MRLAKSSAAARSASVSHCFKLSSNSKASIPLALKMQRGSETRTLDNSSTFDSKILGNGGSSLCSSIACCRSCNVLLNRPHDLCASSYALSWEFKNAVASRLLF